jgi:hypothetical protein
MKIHKVGAKVLHAERQKDRHEEANTHFCESY